MCAVCFTGFQLIPVAAGTARAWWAKKTAGIPMEPSVLDDVEGYGRLERRWSSAGFGPEFLSEDEPHGREQQPEADDAYSRVEKELAPVGGGEAHVLHP